jgi:uncharacterized protein YpuA (DUF1002 family)
METKRAAVSVKIQANTHAFLRKIQSDMVQEMGVNLSLSQVLAIVVLQHDQQVTNLKLRG